MPTTDELDTRLTLAEAYVAQIQSDMVTRHQVSEIGRLSDLNVEAMQDNYIALKSRVDNLIARITSLSQGVLGTAAYTHTQGSASTTWIIIHSLNSQYPAAVFVNGSNQAITPSAITYTNANRMDVTFSTAQSGTARILKVS